jgi:hypothetical protein
MPGMIPEDKTVINAVHDGDFTVHDGRRVYRKFHDIPANQDTCSLR